MRQNAGGRRPEIAGRQLSAAGCPWWGRGRVRPATLVIGVVCLPARTACAHGGPLNRPVDWGDWNLDPVLLLVLGAIAYLYGCGVLRLWSRAAAGQGIARWQVGCFAAGMLVLAAALVSPLDPLSDQLAWAHMTQHMLLMTVAAPLFVAASPALGVLWGLSPAWRQALARLWSRQPLWRLAASWAWHPLAAWLVYVLVTWLWHLPVLYEAAVLDPIIHDVQHVTFFVAACLFWRVVLDPISRFRLAAPLAVIYLFTTTLHATVLGVLMTLAPRPWYWVYEGRTALWGLTTLEDQQLAGLIMWMPACAAYLVVAILLMSRVLTAADDPVSRPRALPGANPPSAPFGILEARATVAADAPLSRPLSVGALGGRSDAMLPASEGAR